ncbi:MAG: hypothetical protein EZS28_019179 [Streblomastix strix]|uniref:Uncharacterized protein n=1 Tax=Streblomastix strix TaxID=222440 RepID=A0A5J4VSW5_9EUKA|nr:MAG: hypothetical protein EZS28_019179 [Streblomastix strix]
MEPMGLLGRTLIIHFIGLFDTLFSTSSLIGEGGSIPPTGFLCAEYEIAAYCGAFTDKREGYLISYDDEQDDDDDEDDDEDFDESDTIIMHQEVMQFVYADYNTGVCGYGCCIVLVLLIDFALGLGVTLEKSPYFPFYYYYSNIIYQNYQSYY